MNRHGFLIAAPQSGSGKTTVSLAIMAALTRRGLTVAPFKCGPDFIDPGYHTLVTGRPSINLDAWMCSERFVRETFQTNLTCRTNQTCQTGQTIAVIEGAMGLFDGFGSDTMSGSSAQIAALTGAPVLLVLNARGMAASAAPLVNGFAAFHPDVRIAGVIFNNTGSATHGGLLREAMAAHCSEVACFGCIPRDETLAIPSRHLGLVTAEDNPLPPEFVGRLADLAERHLDLDMLATLEISGADRFGMIGRGDGADAAGVCADTSRTAATCSRSERPNMAAPLIAVARDAAFCFCYEDNLRLLAEAGAEPVFFSPLADAALPAGTAGIYLPGGYPELYPERLAANEPLKAAIRAAVAAGMPVYAECGGFIYLTQGLEGGADFAGIFPVRTRMLPRRKALGYRQVELSADCLLGPAGGTGRGHEFHYSEIDAMPPGIERVYRVSRRGEELAPEGYRLGSCLASYVHLHFGANPGMAAAFVQACKSGNPMLQS